MNTAELINRISLLRKTGMVITNCFVSFDPSDKTEYEVFSSEKTIIIINCEYKVKRVWFYTTDSQDFAELAASSLNKTEYTLDIIGRDPSLLKDELASAGFTCIAEMMRLSNNNISEVFSSDSAVHKYLDCEHGITAEASDAEEISDILWRTFDTRISHLPDNAKLADMISKGQFMIRRNREQKLVSLLQTVAEPKKLYINQVYNSTEPEIIHAMLLNKIKQYCNQGGKYLYSWVEKNNIASMKFHRKYNLKHDGLWDIVYSNVPEQDIM